MGGDSRSGVGDDLSANNQATQNLLAQLNHRLVADSTPAAPPPPQDAPPQTAAPYGAVAPGALNPGAPVPGRDRYYTPHPGTQTRAGYGVSGSLAPGGAGEVTNKPGGEAVPDFRQLHQDQARDPRQPYEANPVGAQAAGSLPGQPGRPGAPPRDPSGLVDYSNENRIQAAINMRGQYMSPWTALAGGVGALSAPLLARGLSHGADGLVSRTSEGSFFNNVGKYWQNNYDAAKVGKGDFIKVNPKNAAADDAYHALVSNERSALAAAQKAGNQEAADLAARRLELLPRTPTKDILADIEAANRAGLNSETGTGKALFSAEEVATIEGKHMASMSRAAEEAATVKSLQNSTGAIGSFWKPFKAGLVGIGVDLAAVNVDRSLAKAIGGENSLSRSYNTEQILAPLALAVGETWQGKAALLAGSIGVSRLIDGGTQALHLGAPSWINAPTGVMNWEDGFGVAAGLAIAATAKNPWAKAAIVGAGWAIPKIAHTFEDQSAANTRHTFDTLNDDLKADHKDRSLGSLDDVTSAARALNDRKEDWLVGKIAMNRNYVQAQWNNIGYDQKLLALRDDAGMSTALGEDLLKKGTRIEHQGAPEYTLGGYEMDLGGRAMHYLVGGKDSLDRAENLTKGIIQNNNDSSKQPILVDGSKPTQAEVDAMDKYRERIQKDLGKILDQEHDCKAVMDQVVKNIPSSSPDWLNTYIRPVDGLIEHYIPRNTPEQLPETRKIIGKLYRDEAIAYMAAARDKLDRGHDGGGALSLLTDDPGNHQDIFPSGRQKSYNGAQGVLIMAQKFDPDAKDLPQLLDMWKGMVKDAQTAAGVQMTDSNINILNVGGLAPRPQH